MDEFVTFQEALRVLHFKETFGGFFTGTLKFSLKTVFDSGPEGDLKSLQTVIDLLRTGDAAVAPEGRRTWEGFYAAIIGQYQQDHNGAVPSVGTDPFDGLIWENFRDRFKEFVGMNNLNLGDWQPLAGLIGPGAPYPDFDEFTKDFFVRSFNKFISTYPFPASIDPSDYGSDDLVDAWADWLTLRTGIDEPPEFQNLTPYKTFYDEFVPNGTEQDFEERIQAYVQRMIAENGYFLPSHHLEGWFDEVQLEARVRTDDLSSITGTKSEETRVLFELFKLLVEMIEVLQKVAATQGQRLTFYANMQKAYTTAISQIPTFTSDLVDISTNKEGKSLLLNQLNSKSQSLTETLRAFRGVFADEAKQHQTVVNQSNEVVNQQTNLGSSILQQMSTIVTTLFK